MKRFTDTTKWSDPWFQDLRMTDKMFWIYILDNCDAAGVWKVNLKLASFQIGNDLSDVELLDVFRGRIEDLGGGRWWVKKFCHFQYKTLSRQCPAHARILELAERHGIKDRMNGSSKVGLASHPHTTPIPSRYLEEEDKEEDKDKE